MAKTLRGLTVKIGSDTTGLGKALKDVNKKSRDIRSELRKVERLLKFNPENTELLAQKQQLLSDRVENTSEKLRRLKSVQDQVNEQFQKGEIGEQQYRDFKREIVKTESKLESFEKQLKSTNATSGQLAAKMREMGNKLNNVGTKLKGVGQKLSGMSAVLTGAFTALTVGTRDFRKEISVLENNTRSAGANMDNMSKAMKQMQGVTGELDSNVEGLSNLLAADFKGDQFQQVLDELSGAAIKFKDTLKFEGIADGLQETLATGSAVGPFAELLERSGIQLDSFNSGLQESIKNGTQQNYILQTLADTGLANVYEQYKKNNSELVNSAEAQYSLQEALGKLGKILEPIMTKIIVLATKVVNKFNDLSPAGQQLSLIIAGIATAIGPVLVALGSLATAIGAITAPVLGTIAAVAAFIAIGTELYRHWEKVKDALSSTLNVLKSAFSTWVSLVELDFATMKATVLTVIDAIIDKLSVLEKLPFGVGEKFKGLGDAVGESAEKARAEVERLAKEAKENGTKVADSATKAGIAFSDFGTSVAKDVSGVVGNIKNMVSGTTKAMAKETEIITSEQKKQTQITKDGNETRTNLTKNNEEDQTEITEEEARKRAETKEDFEESWNDKLFNLTATRIEILEREKERAIAEAEAKGASTEAIEKYYAQKKNQIRENFEESWQDKLFRLTATKEQRLELEKERALERAKNLGTDKQAILEYYAQKEQELLSTQLAKYQNHGNAITAAVSIWKDSVKNYVTNLKNNTAEASMAMAKSMTSFFDSFSSGSKTFKEAVKEMALSFVTMAEQRVIAAQAAGIAESWALAPATFGASLAYIGQIASAVAPALATFETVKAVIRKFADGGVVTGPTIGMIGEAGDDEAVIPLRKDVLANLGAGIAAHMPKQQQPTIAGRPIEVTLQVGTLVADDLGLKKLERKLRSIRIGENARLGVNTR